MQAQRSLRKQQKSNPQALQGRDYIQPFATATYRFNKEITPNFQTSLFLIHQNITSLYCITIIIVIFMSFNLIHNLTSMAKLTIYLKQVNGHLEYRDSENHQGQTITSHVKPGSKIVWKLDKCSGITEINSITIKGDEAILNGKPRKKDYDHWEARAADKGEGEVSYIVNVVKCEKCAQEEAAMTQKMGDPEPPKLRVP
jgi:hypothetical protein